LSAGKQWLGKAANFVMKIDHPPACSERGKQRIYLECPYFHDQNDLITIMDWS